MPRKRPSGDDPRTQRAREEMILGPSAVDLDVHDFSVRVAGLPLFRRTEDGDLSQVLRLVVLAESVAGDVTFTVSDGDTTLDTARARIDRGSTLVHLFVPEVHEPRTFSLRVEATGREPFEAEVEILPQRKWSVFLIHHSHLDIGYTDTQARYYSITCSIWTRSWIWSRPPTTGRRMRSSVGTWKPTGHCSTG